MTKLTALAEQLNTTTLLVGETTIETIEDSLLVTFTDLIDFPIHVIIDDESIRCWTVLASIEDIKEDKIDILNATLLTANGVSSLSNFSIIDGFYCLTGDLSADSIFSNIVLELNTLIKGSEDALENIFLPVIA